MNEDERLFELTKNVIRKDQLLGIDKRNWLEAIVEGVLVLLFIMILPFTAIVKIVSIIVIEVVLWFFNLRGYKNRSLIQIILAEYKFKKNRRMLHLRGPEYRWTKGAYTYNEDDSNKSEIEKLYGFIKKHVSRFVEKYSDNDNC